MSGHQTATLEDTVYFWFAANDTSGSGGDGATPLFDVREAGAAASAIPLLSGTPSLLSHANYPAGCHEIAVAATAANGFAADDTFGVFCTLAVDSQNPSGFVGSCTLTPLAKAAALATVDSNVDAILIDTGEIGTAGAGLTNINLPNQTMDIVGNITGSLSGSVNSVTTEVTADVTSWNGATVAIPTVAGVPEVDVTHVAGAAQNIATATALATVDTEVGNMQGDVTLILADTADIQPNYATSTALAAAQTDLDTITDSGVVLTAAGVDAVWDEVLNVGHAVANSAAVILSAVLADTADIQPNYATSTALATVDTEIGNMQGDVTNILTDTGTTLPNQITALNDFDVTTQLTESYAANGVAPTTAEALFAIHQMLMQFGIVSTSNTIRKLDNTTTAFVVTLDSATAPTDAKRI